jgi:hypothetical protein
MLHRRETIGWLTVAMLIAGPLTLSGAAPELQRPQAIIAQMEARPTRIEWRPQVEDYERLILTIAGPGDFYMQRAFGSGEVPSFSSLDGQDGRLPDGAYTYELRAVPRLDPELLEKLGKARETGDVSATKELQTQAGLQERALVQSGHLWVQGGSFVDKVPTERGPSGQSEPASKTPIRNFVAKDIVQNDDLIVQGGACIGEDCVNGDADYGRLKLKVDIAPRIILEATGCCFPAARDWALEAGDSDQDGFLIHDLDADTIPFWIAGGAPNNALVIFPSSAAGRIGMGTLTPAVQLDVKGSAAGQATARLQNSSATGYSGIEYLDNNGIVDLFFGIDNAASTTRLNSINNNPILLMTNSAERMRITSGGSVGIGTASPDARLDVENSGSVEIRMTITNSNVWQLLNDFPGFGIQLVGTGFRAVNVDGGGNMQLHGTLTQGSSRDLKTDFVSLDPQDVLAKINALPVSTWRYKLDGPAIRHVGPTAEDFHQAFGLGGDDKRIAPSDQAGVALIAVQGLTRRVEDKAQEIEALRRKNADLEERIAALEALLVASPPQE